MIWLTLLLSWAQHFSYVPKKKRRNMNKIKLYWATLQCCIKNKWIWMLSKQQITHVKQILNFNCGSVFFGWPIWELLLQLWSNYMAQNVQGVACYCCVCVAFFIHLHLHLLRVKGYNNCCVLSLRSRYA